MRRILAFASLLLAVITAGCGESNGRRGFGRLDVAGVGQIIADPVRDQIYFTDRPTGRVFAISTRTGLQVGLVAVGTEAAGLAIDVCADRLFVTVPIDGQVQVIDLETFTVASSHEIGSSVESIEWVADDSLVGVGIDGLVDVDLANDTTTVLDASIDPSAELQIGPDHQLVYVAQSPNGATTTDVYRFDLVELQLSAPTALAGSVISLDIAFSNDRLFVATNGGDGVTLLVPSTFEEITTYRIVEGISAMAINPPATRMYVAVRNVPLVDHYSLDLATVDPANPEVLRSTSFPSALRDHSLVVSSNSLKLVGVLSTEQGGEIVAETVVTEEAFETTRLFAPSVAFLGSDYRVELQGTPGNAYTFLEAFAPGYIPVDLPGDESFIDLEQQMIFGGMQGMFNPATGTDSFICPVGDDRMLLDLCPVVQCLSFDPLTGELESISNPVKIRILDCNDDATP